MKKWILLIGVALLAIYAGMIMTSNTHLIVSHQGDHLIDGGCVYCPCIYHEYCYPYLNKYRVQLARNPFYDGPPCGECTFYLCEYCMPVPTTDAEIDRWNRDVKAYNASK